MTHGKRSTYVHQGCRCSDCTEAAAKYAKEHRRKGRAYTQVLKSRPCADCGVQYPPHVMDFDHVQGKKADGVSRLVGLSRGRIEAEAAKCEVVCANCHRERTYVRRNSEPVLS